ncbi:MAG: hypothetical protein ACREON_10055, partial [Gemmatimonadaceae bacterium]
TIVQVAPEKLTPLAGRYAVEVSPSTLITITVDSGRVFAAVPGQSKIEIYPESETRYFAVEQDLEFVFSPGEQGKITGLVLNAGPASSYKAKRVE